VAIHCRSDRLTSNDERGSLRLVLDEIQQLRASQVDILALLQQRSDSKADFAHILKLSQSLAQNFNADMAAEMKLRAIEFWRKIFPTQDNVSKSLERWISLVGGRGAFIEDNPPALYDCLLVAEGGISPLPS
jgi:hypothetical protein